MDKSKKVPYDSRAYIPGGPPQFLSRSVMATFQDVDRAKEAQQALNQEGFRGSQIDEVSWRPSNSGNLTDQPFPETMTGQAGDRTQRATAAMDPSISGNAEGFGPVLGKYRFLLTVPLEEGQSIKKATEIVRRHGGNVDQGGPN